MIATQAPKNAKPGDVFRKLHAEEAATGDLAGALPRADDRTVLDEPDCRRVLGAAAAGIRSGGPYAALLRELDRPRGVDGPPRRRLASAAGVARAAGAPWTLGGAAAELVVVVSTRRSASTEAAEVVGDHPCGASFNELLHYDKFPSGFPKYAKGSHPSDFLDLPTVLKRGRPKKGLGHDDWLGDATAARAKFCESRPAVVRDACGDTCVVALKLHVDNFVEGDRDPKFAELVTAPTVAAVLLERDAAAARCSLDHARAHGDWGHTPDAHAAAKDACRPGAATRDYGRRVAARFRFAREALDRAGRPRLELPFDAYVADVANASARILAAAGLALPPEPWRRTCAEPWCANASWPACDRCLGD